MSGAGFMTLFLFPMGITALLHGMWVGLIAFGIPVGMIALGRWAGHMKSDYHVYRDRIEFPNRENSMPPLLWSDVQKICWEGKEEGTAAIRFHVPRCEKRPMGQGQLSFDDLSRKDRLRLIQHVRELGKTLEQEGWPRFCRKCAVPLVEYFQGKPDAGMSPSLPSFVGRFAKQHPFLADAAVLPIAAMLLSVRQVSRPTWWLLAGLVFASAFINIRLIWGAWFAPFTMICVGIAIAMFAIGLIAPRNVATSRNTRVSDAVFYLVLALFIIGLPLFGNAAVLGWLPRPVAKAGGYVFLAMLYCVPAIMGLATNQRENRQRPALEADALRRWEIYEETGILPESDLDESSEA